MICWFGPICPMCGRICLTGKGGGGGGGELHSAGTFFPFRVPEFSY